MTRHAAERQVFDGGKNITRLQVAMRGSMFGYNYSTVCIVYPTLYMDFEGIHDVYLS